MLTAALIVFLPIDLLIYFKINHFVLDPKVTYSNVLLWLQWQLFETEQKSKYLHLTHCRQGMFDILVWKIWSVIKTVADDHFLSLDDSIIRHSSSQSACFIRLYIQKVFISQIWVWNGRMLGIHCLKRWLKQLTVSKSGPSLIICLFSNWFVVYLFLLWICETYVLGKLWLQNNKIHNSLSDMKSLVSCDT